MDASLETSQAPPEVVQSWPPPNYVNPQTRGPALVILTCIFFPLALIVVGLRLYTRLRVSRSAGLDDLFIVLASVRIVYVVRDSRCSSGCMYRLKVTAASVYSWNLHIWDIPADEIIPGQEIAFTARFFFVWATNLTKISILLFYRRISANCRNTLFHTAVWTLIIIVALYMITVSVGMLAMCSPIGGFWNFNSSPQCMDETYFELVAAICNVVLEFTIIFLPLPTIWKLQLPKAQKWALSALFMLGIFVCMAGTVRVYYFDEVAYKTYDTTWEGYLLWVCVSLETGIALICASAPALRPLYKHYFNDTEVQEFSEARDFPEPNIFGPNPMELNQVGNSRHEETSQIFRHSGTESIIITMLPEHIDTLYRPPRSIRDLGDQSSTSSLRTWREKEPLPMV